MTFAFYALLGVQIVLGGLDNLLHHELTEKLPQRVSARREIALHAVRELIYGLLFLIFAWTEPKGVFALAVVALLLVEIVVTLTDFVEEDRTRTLPPLERVLHTVLAINFGALIAIAAPSFGTWIAEPSAVAPTQHGLVSWALSACALGVGAWGVRDAIAAFALRARSTPEASAPASGKTILVAGGTGFLGEAFVRRRLALGDRVVVVSRDVKRAAALFDHAVLAIADPALLPDMKIDAVVNLAGAGVANALWTEGRKRQLVESRLDAAEALGRLMARLSAKPDVFVSASAVGFYGDRGEESLSEGARPGAGFPSDLCVRWEAATALAGQGAERTVRLRFGLVFGRDGGAFPRMAASLPARLATQFGDGRQWMAWVHKEDALGLLDFAIETRGLSGPINAVAPGAARHGEVVAALARAAGAVATLPIPAAGLRIGLGEMSSLFLASQRVAPSAALAAGYAFRFPTIEGAAADLLGARPIAESATVADASLPSGEEAARGVG